MNLNNFIDTILNESLLKVGQKFKIDNVQYEIIHCLTNKCKVKICSGKEKDEERYFYNSMIKKALNG